LDSTRRKMTTPAPRFNETLIDEAFFVYETRFGLWSTQTVPGYEFDYGSTGLTRDGVIRMTRWTLKHLQEGDLHLYTREVNVTMGVKL